MLGNLKKLILFMKKRLDGKDKRNIAILIFIALLTNILIVLIPLIQKHIIDDILQKQMYKSSIFIFLVLSILLSGIKFIEVFLLNSIRISLQKNITMNMLTSISKKENKIIKTRGSGAFMSRVFSDSEQFSMLLETNYFFSIGVFIAAIVTIIITLSWTWSFFLIILVSYIVMAFGIKVCTQFFTQNFALARELVFKLNPKVLEFIENRRSIMSYGSISQYLKRLEDIIDERDGYIKKASVYDTLGNTIIENVKNIAITVFFIVSMIEILNSKLDVSSFITMTSYFNIVFLPILSIKQIYGALNKFQMLYSRSSDIFDVPIKVHLPNKNELIIKDISFSYDNTIILKNIDIKLDKVYGIVGISGEGKTTLLKLLTGELTPTKGEIIYGKTNISNIPMNMIYSCFRYYSQDVEIFDDDLLFNITLGKKGISKNEYYKEIDIYKNLIKESLTWLISEENPNLDKNENVKKIIKEIYNLTDEECKNKNILNKIRNSLNFNNLAETADFISQIYVSRKYYIEEKYRLILSDLKLDYLSGRNFGQRGKYLSGGEKNKVALARFLLPEIDVPIIIDEPFTNLDLISEQENLQVLNKYISGSKGIIVSHKLDVIKLLSDEIIVINNSEIESRGLHDELLNSSMLYAELYEKFLEKKFALNA
ncbi:ABC transporter transmembrane domain-containing protein [Caloranaerobacter sp. DY30410]|uniref:ABC transporter transmembrane domain-containing protein n=1 Tax=Caloranaerobacter sp. DY30410 TaxID=3238305 RepID=UPI003D02A97F